MPQLQPLKRSRNQKRRHDQKRDGATVVLMLILLVVVFTFLAFSIDLGRVQLAQLKLQSASDFAARAGTEALARGVGDTSDLALYEAAIRDEIDMVMQSNEMFGSAVTFDKNTQVEFGTARLNGARFNFTAGSGGSMDPNTNSLRVDPNLSQFPMIFGGFTGRDSLPLNAATTTKVEDRDIVVVIDRSSSMLDHDAGTILLNDYNSNLFAVEDALYGPEDQYNPESGIRDNYSVRHTEFEVDSGVINLSRAQALKLALLRFRQQIDSTRGIEKLGLVTYADVASSPSQVTIATPNSSVDIVGGLTIDEFDAIVDNGITETESTLHPDIEPHEHTASAMEDDSNDYRDFDFNYLRTRWCESTNIADGILKGADVLYAPGARRTFAKPIMIVMTDGRHNGSSTPEDAANTVIAAHPEMLIFTITFGSRASQNPMKTVASTGGGEHFHADDVDGLVAIFEKLATQAGVTVIE